MAKNYNDKICAVADAGADEKHFNKCWPNWLFLQGKAGISRIHEYTSTYTK